MWFRKQKLPENSIFKPIGRNLTIGLLCQRLAAHRQTDRMDKYTHGRKDRGVNIAFGLVKTIKINVKRSLVSSGEINNIMWKKLKHFKLSPLEN